MSTSVLVRIAACLGIPTSELLGDGGSASAESEFFRSLGANGAQELVQA